MRKPSQHGAKKKKTRNGCRYRKNRNNYSTGTMFLSLLVIINSTGKKKTTSLVLGEKQGGCARLRSCPATKSAKLPSLVGNHSFEEIGWAGVYCGKEKKGGLVSLRIM